MSLWYYSTTYQDELRKLGGTEVKLSIL